MIPSILLALVLSGPIPAEVVRVLDGDTVKVAAHPWPDQINEVSVRIRGVDTPEKAPQAKCPQEAELAKKASAFTKEQLPVGTKVQLQKVGHDKYAGRVVADLLVGNESLADLLIRAGLARPYGGGTKSSWCKEDL